jgi:putative hydrolase of the HAD superfamily
VEQRIIVTDIVFDFFGTLADFDRDRQFCHVQKALHAFLSDLGIAIPESDFADLMTETFAELERRALSTLYEYHMLDVAAGFFHRVGYTESIGAIREQFVELFMTEWNRLVYYDPAVQPFLAGLSDTHRLSVLSNTHHPPSVPGHLRAMGLAPYVSQVVTSVEFGRRKPHPSIFHHALERLGSAPDQAIYVGDDYAADYLGATAAGMRCILIDPERQHPELGIHRVSSLLEIAGRLQ